MFWSHVIKQKKKSTQVSHSSRVILKTKAYEILNSLIVVVISKEVQSTSNISGNNSVIFQHENIVKQSGNNSANLKIEKHNIYNLKQYTSILS